MHGRVRLARNMITGERVAVKIVEREARKRLGGSSALLEVGKRMLKGRRASEASASLP